MGLIIAARWPVSGLFIIGLFVAIELIFHGWSYIVLERKRRFFSRRGPNYSRM